MKKIQVNKDFEENIYYYIPEDKMIGHTIEFIDKSRQVVVGKCVGYWFNDEGRKVGLFIDTNPKDTYSGLVQFQAISWEDIFILDTWLDYEQIDEFGIPDLPGNTEELVALARQAGRKKSPKANDSINILFPLLPGEKKKLIEWALFLDQLGFCWCWTDHLSASHILFEDLFEARIQYDENDDIGSGCIEFGVSNKAYAHNNVYRDEIYQTDPKGVEYPIKLVSEIEGTWEEVLRKVLEHEIFIVNKKKEMGIE